MCDAAVNACESGLAARQAQGLLGRFDMPGLVKLMRRQQEKKSQERFA